MNALTQRFAVAPLAMGVLPAGVLLLVAAVLGPGVGAPFRMVFIAACGVVGWLAWRQSPGTHLQAALILFAFAPFVRRMIDLTAGFDPTGLMLVGPLVALIAPVTQLRALLDDDRLFRAPMAPLMVVAGCVIYAAALSLFQGEVMNAATATVKWLVPLLYAALLMSFCDRDEMMQAAASAFIVLLPLMGLYGLYQYVDPPAWDQYWMRSAPIMSAGQPVAFAVRTFSTMNGPASFATFTAVGLIVIGFLRPGWAFGLAATPAVLALLLSQYRTAWISLAVSLVFCLAFAPTRRRAGVIVACAAVAVALALVLTPFGEVIGERLSTLGQGSADGSLQERLDQFVLLWNAPDSTLFGGGFTTTDVGSAGAMAIDGMFIACWLTMGIVFGLICVGGFVWAAARAIALAVRHTRRETVVIGALAVGALAQMPFASIASGELGVLFWTFSALAMAGGAARRGTIGAAR